jgi:hypothetical protein
MTHQDVLVIYIADDLPQAELIRQHLEGKKIDAFVERTASPFDGLTNIGQGTPIMVRSEDAARARQAIMHYLEQTASPDAE